MPSILARMGRDVSDEELQLFAWVILSIIHSSTAADDAGEEAKQVGLQILERRLADARPKRPETPRKLSKKEENLSRLIEVYRSLDVVDSNTWPE